MKDRGKEHDDDDTVHFLRDIIADFRACLGVADGQDLVELHTVMMTILDRHDVLAVEHEAEESDDGTA